jgi:hypothetical protein
MILVALLAIAAASAPVQPGSAVDICMRAAAAVAHSSVNDADRESCTCSDQQLHKLLHGGDYALHLQMQTILATGTDEANFNKQLSDAMLKRSMTQSDADAFFARLKAAEANAAAICDDSPLLGRPLTPTH